MSRNGTRNEAAQAAQARVIQLVHDALAPHEGRELLAIHEEHSGRTLWLVDQAGQVFTVQVRPVSEQTNEAFAGVIGKYTKPAVASPTVASPTVASAAGGNAA